VAMADVLELLEAAEAKAYYGLAINWKPLQALTQALLDRGVLQVCVCVLCARTSVICNGLCISAHAGTAGQGCAARVGLARTVYKYTGYDRIFGDFPAKDVVYAPYIYIYIYIYICIYSYGQHNARVVSCQQRMG